MIREIPDLVQRWRERRDQYRPAREPIDARRFGVELIEERQARMFVERHHYSGSYPAARCAFGLFQTSHFRRAELVEGPFRRVRHPGNFAYVWPLAPTTAAALAPALPYPKAVPL